MSKKQTKLKSKSSISIETRKVSKHTIVRGKDKNKKEYTQYRITLPKKFAEEHDVDEMYLIADSIGMFVPDQETLLQVLVKFPEIRKLVLSKRKNTNVSDLLGGWNLLSKDEQTIILEKIQNMITTEDTIREL